MGGDGRGETSAVDDTGDVGELVRRAVAALSGPPGAESAWALEQGLRACPVSFSSRPSGPSQSSSSTSASGSSSGSVSWSAAGVAARRSRVFAGFQRQSCWVTYGVLVEAAQWVRDWQANPPISSGLPDEPDEPDEPEVVDGEPEARR